VVDQKPAEAGSEPPLHAAPAVPLVPEPIKVSADPVKPLPAPQSIRPVAASEAPTGKVTTADLPAVPLAPEAKQPIEPVTTPDSAPLTVAPPVETKPITPVRTGDPKQYWAEQGDTLRDIARKALGSEERWREIETLNPELRARTLVPAGTMVRLPVAEATTPGGQAESEYVPPARPTGLKPLPFVRARPEAGKRDALMLGTYECKLDGKNGLTLPREVCEQLGKCDTLLLTPGPDRCLWLVTEAGAARVLRRVENVPVDSDEVQAFRRMFFAQSRKVTRDAAGTTALPVELAEYAGLTGAVVLIGCDDHFELWDAGRWQQYSRQNASTPKSSRTSDE
jgi:MraZ protein